MTQTAERRAFDRGSGVELLDALAASSAVPGIRALVTIDGQRYMDRRTYSIDNADLVAEYHRVLILTLKARMRSFPVVPLESALVTLRGR